MNNGEHLKESMLNLQICLAKGYILKRDKEEFGREIKCIPGTHDFEESMFDLIILDYITLQMKHHPTCIYIEIIILKCTFFQNHALN